MAALAPRDGNIVRSQRTKPTLGAPRGGGPNIPVEVKVGLSEVSGTDSTDLVGIDSTVSGSNPFNDGEMTGDSLLEFMEMTVMPLAQKAMDEVEARAHKIAIENGWE
eukprot:gene18540-5997_t